MTFMAKLWVFAVRPPPRPGGRPIGFRLRTLGHRRHRNYQLRYFAVFDPGDRTMNLQLAFGSECSRSSDYHPSVPPFGVYWLSVSSEDSGDHHLTDLSKEFSIVLHRRWIFSVTLRLWWSRQRSMRCRSSDYHPSVPPFGVYWLSVSSEDSGDHHLTDLSKEFSIVLHRRWIFSVTLRLWWSRQRSMRCRLCSCLSRAFCACQERGAVVSDICLIVGSVVTHRISGTYRLTGHTGLGFSATGSDWVARQSRRESGCVSVPYRTGGRLVSINGPVDPTSR